MSYPKVLLFVFGLILGLSQCAFVETLKKCKLQDKDCQKNGIQEIILVMSDSGIPELEIPRSDPFQLKTINLSILNVIDLTLADAVVEGFRTCVVDEFDLNIEGLYSTISLICDITVKGKYDVSSSSDVIKNVLGHEIHGSGQGKIAIEKVKITLKFAYKVEKRGEDTYFKGALKDVKHSFEVLGKVKFDADKLFLGDKESTKEMVDMLNQNSPLMVSSFGDHFVNVALEIIHKYIRKFFDTVPTKHYIVEDLSSYV